MLAWSALEQKAGGKAERVAALEAKVAAVTEAQKAGNVGTAFSPDFLLVALMSLATAGSVASPFAPPPDPKAADRQAAIRNDVIEAVRLIANVGKRSRTKGDKRE